MQLDCLYREMVGKTRKARGSYRGCLTPARLVEANVCVSCLRLLLASNLRAAFVSVSVLQFARILALDHYVSFSDLGRRALGRGAGGKRLSGVVCDCRGKQRLGAHPTDTR